MESALIERGSSQIFFSTEICSTGRISKEKYAALANFSRENRKHLKIKKENSEFAHSF
jgi:hypothetical protein